MSVHLSERERKILRILSEDNSINVNDMSKTFDVSTVTIRNDLASLSEKGMILRTRGGAIPAFHPSILDRQRNLVDKKNKIAQAAADLIENGDTVMIGAGTTTALIAKYLLGKQDLHIVTNSTLIITYARINPSIHLTVVGGEFRPSTESLVGPITLRELEQFHVKKAFIGTDGFSLDKGLTTHLVDGAEVTKQIARQTDRKILIADSTKYGKEGFVKILPISDFDMIITDTGLSGEVEQAFTEQGFQVVRV